MTRALLNRLLIPALASSLVVGCAPIPTTQKTPTTTNQQQQQQEPEAVTAASVKDFLVEAKQTLTLMRALNGASEFFASSLSPEEPNNSSSWGWDPSEDEGTETRHVIEKNQAGETVTEIQSTRTTTSSDSSVTITQEDVVTKSAVMAPGTYRVTNTTTVTGEAGDDDFLVESEKTSIYTPVGGSPRQAKIISTLSSAGATLSISGLLADGSTIACSIDVTGTETTQTMTIDARVTKPNGRVLSYETSMEILNTSQDESSITENKGFFQVALENLMQVRLEFDVAIDSESPQDTPPIRNLITGELRDGAGKRLATLDVETKETNGEPIKATLTLEGESPTELDLSALKDLTMFLSETAFAVY